ncbi:MAG: PHP domain-containing protein [Lachnospiraceae bacterium]|nr:PHP domain-containing protein [Lachnospiraceae bacterium]
MDKRIELHCHTKMSKMAGLCDIKELMLKAAELGVEGIAITDTDSVQSFPNAYYWLKRITTYESLRGTISADRLPRVFFGMEIRLRDDVKMGLNLLKKILTEHIAP